MKNVGDFEGSREDDQGSTLDPLNFEIGDIIQASWGTNEMRAMRVVDVDPNPMVPGKMFTVTLVEADEPEPGQPGTPSGAAGD